MKIIFTRMIPRQRFTAVNLMGIVFAPKDAKISVRTIQHEAIHTVQMKEMLYIFFYAWYLMEWLIRLFGSKNAYRNISFEKEAYSNEHNKNYLNNRKPYSWIRFF